MADISISIGADGQLLVTGFNAAEQSVKRFSGNVSGSINATSTAVNKLTADVGFFTRAWGVIATGGFVGGMLNSAAAAQQTQLRLQNLSGSAKAYAENQVYLTELAGRYGTSLEVLTDGYARILTLESAQVVSRQQGRKILEGLANAQAFLGATSAQTGQAMYGMQQAFTAGTVRAEELNQVTEPLPGLLQKLDAAAGLSAGGFRRLVTDGQVTSEMFRDVLVKALGEYSGAAERNNDSLTAGLNKLGTIGTQTGTSLSNLADGPVNALADGLLFAAEALGSDGMELLLGGVLASGATILAGRMVQSALASHAATQAYTLQATAAHRLALAEQVAAQEALMFARYKGISAVESNELAIAEHRLAAANTAVASTGKAASASMGLMGRAMSAMGGPWMIALSLAALAVPLVYDWATAESQAAEEVAKSRRALHEHSEALEVSSHRRRVRIEITKQDAAAEEDFFTKIEKLDQAQTQMEIRRLNRQRAEQRERLFMLEKEAKSRFQMISDARTDSQASSALNSFAATSKAAKEQSAIVQELDDKIKVLAMQYHELGKATAPMISENEKANDKLKKYNESLQEKIASLGKSGAELEAVRAQQLLSNSSDEESKKVTQELIAALREKEAAQKAETEAKQKAVEADRQAESVAKSLLTQYAQRSSIENQHAANVVALTAKYGKNKTELAKLIALEEKDYQLKLASIDPQQKLITGLDEQIKALQEEVAARAVYNREGFISLQLAKAGVDASAEEVAAIRLKAGALYDLNQQKREQERLDQSAKDAAAGVGQLRGDDIAGSDFLQAFDPTGMLQAQQEAQMEILRESYEEKQEMAALDYEIGLASEEEYQQQKLLIDQEFGEARRQLKEQHESEMNQINQRAHFNEIMWARMTWQQKAVMTVGALGQLAGSIAAYNQARHKDNKKAAKSSAILGTAAGVAKALDNPWPINLIAAASVAIAGLAQIKTINSTSYGGGSSPPVPSGSSPSLSSSGIADSGANAPAALPEIVNTTRTAGTGTSTTTVEVNIGTVNGGFGDQNNMKEVITKTVQQAVEPVIVPALQNYTAKDGVLFKRDTRQALELTGP